MSSQKPFQSNIFVPSARAFRTLYMDIPGFKSDHIAVYDVLYHYWNPDYGYAWPSSCDIQLETGYGETHVRALIKDLVKWRLIEVLTNPNGDNKTYNLLKPIEDSTHFYRVFPEAVAAGEARRVKARERAARPKRAKRPPKKPVKAVTAAPPSTTAQGVPTREQLDQVFTASAESGPEFDLSIF
ncbi:hypothetical protein D3C75_771200 [compost metagenome]